jgi:hypothetical protein
MRPPFKPEFAYNEFLRDGRMQTTAFYQPSVRDYMSNIMYGPGHAERAIAAQTSHTCLLQLLCKLKAYKHIPQ